MLIAGGDKFGGHGARLFHPSIKAAVLEEIVPKLPTEASWAVVYAAVGKKTVEYKIVQPLTTDSKALTPAKLEVWMDRL